LGYVGIWLPGVLAGIFVLENLGGIEGFARSYAQHLGESMMRTLYKELKDLLEGGDTNG